MKIAVISDVHGNSAALDAVLEDIGRHGVDRIANLGDHLSGPLDPAGTADRLMALDHIAITGNHDRWLVHPPKQGMPLWETWARPHLTEAHLSWIASLPDSAKLDDVLLCHGVPGDDTQNWLYQRGKDRAMRRATFSEVAPYAEGQDESVILSGHTHMPCMARLPDGPLLVNPGSVGCPGYLDDRSDPPFVAETGASDARYAIVTRLRGVWSASLHMVPYDAREMIERAHAMGAESWAQALSIGWMRE